MHDGIFIGKGQADAILLPKYANRHGLITGATGTGKTVTLQGLVESFSAIGVPVFMADVKGDLVGVGKPGGGNPKVEARAEELGLAPLSYQGSPVVLWDLFGERGHPVRTTISEMGPLLLARMLDLNQTQEGVLNVAFKLADDEGLLLLDLKDLRAMLTFVAENAKAIQTDYGNVSAASVGAIQRALLTFEQQGGDLFFGEPALELHDIMRTDANGRGVVSILAAERLMQSPRLYATFLLWMLAELFEELPEAGDLEKPKLVYFFDEAHLLFEDAPKELLDKIEQVVRLIRSKGVGVYFVTQNPLDVPETVLGQLGNRIQHALRAFTPRDQKAVKAAATTFRPNPAFSTEEAITQLGVGEALVSTLDAKGAPNIVDRVFIKPPLSRLGTLTDQERKDSVAASPISGKYDKLVDRDSAHEILRGRADQAAADAERARAEEERAKAEELRQKEFEKMQRQAEREASPRARRSYDYGGAPRKTHRSRGSDTMLEATAKSVLRSAGSQVGRQLVRGILGSLFRGR